MRPVKKSPVPIRITMETGPFVTMRAVLIGLEIENRTQDLAKDAATAI